MLAGGAIGKKGAMPEPDIPHEVSNVVSGNRDGGKTCLYLDTVRTSPYRPKYETRS